MTLYRSELKDYPLDGYLWICMNDTEVFWCPFSSFMATVAPSSIPRHLGWISNGGSWIIRGKVGLSHIRTIKMQMPASVKDTHDCHIFKADVKEHLKRWETITSTVRDVGLLQATNLILDYDEASWMFLLTFASENVPHYHVLYNSISKMAGGIELMAQNPAFSAFQTETTDAKSTKFSMKSNFLPPLMLYRKTLIPGEWEPKDDEITIARAKWLQSS